MAYPAIVPPAAAWSRPRSSRWTCRLCKGFVVDAQDRCSAMGLDMRLFTDVTDFVGTALTVTS
jgi:hypothetical protein